MEHRELAIFVKLHTGKMHLVICVSSPSKSLPIICLPANLQLDSEKLKKGKLVGNEESVMNSDTEYLSLGGQLQPSLGLRPYSVSLKLFSPCSS